MRLSDFDYNLPPELIAQEPVESRDHSRLLVLDKETGEIEHKRFYDLPGYLQAGDVLVMNNSKVFPARLFGKRKNTGGKLEIFLLRNLGTSNESLPLAKGGVRRGSVWQCLVGGRRAKPGLKIEFEEGLRGELLKDNEDQTWEIEFNSDYKEVMEILNRIGQVPLPPYIKRLENRKQKTDDRKTYQTVYADEGKTGSVAAPTAGLHFTPEVLERLKNKGVEIEYVTLHVGLGTFAPVKVDNVLEHKMHSEYVEIEQRVIERIEVAKKENRRIITVGTTSTRALESFFTKTTNYQLIANSYTAWVDIFIYPGFEFKAVDAMITNFHLPKSTLLMLVSALAGKDNIDKAYAEAIEKKYRFFSYGDAMMIK